MSLWQKIHKGFFIVFRKNIRMETREQASASSQGESKSGKAEEYRSQADIIQKAREMYRQIEDERLRNKPPEEFRQETLPEIQACRAELNADDTSHLEQRHSRSQKEMVRNLTHRDKNTRAKLVGDLTKRNRTSLSEICSALSNDASQKGKKAKLTNEQLNDIRLLVKVAIVQSEKTSRRGDKSLTEEIYRELVQYSIITAQIEKWAKSLKDGGNAPELMSPELRHEHEILSLEAMYDVAMPLLKEFKKSFPKAAELIQECVPAMQLVAEAAKAGVVFGGYSGESPLKDTLHDWPYCSGNKVYIPKVETDYILATRSFLFELNNGINASKVNAMIAEAKPRRITAEEFARGRQQLEDEGAWRLAEIWTQMKPQIEKTTILTNLDKYDDEFYLTDLKKYKDQQYSENEILEERLNRKYPAGGYAGKTVREWYVNQYNQL
jgi:hypothetical protein